MIISKKNVLAIFIFILVLVAAIGSARLESLWQVAPSPNIGAGVNRLLGVSAV